VLSCDRLRSGDWLIAVSLSEADPASSLFSGESVTAEVAAQLTCRLRRQKYGRPAALFSALIWERDDPLDSPFQDLKRLFADACESTFGDAALEVRRRRRMARTRVRLDAGHLLVCGDFLDVRNAARFVGFYGGVLFAEFPSEETVLVIIEEAEGICLRCSRPDDVLRAVRATAASLNLAIDTSRKHDPEWAQEFMDAAVQYVDQSLAALKRA